MKRVVFILSSIICLLTLFGCSSLYPGSVQINETGQNTVTEDETIPINNCNGSGEIRRTSERSIDVEIGNGASLNAGYGVVQGAIVANYQQTGHVHETEEVVAPPGKNVQIILHWTEEVHAGSWILGGQSGNYTVHSPISVDSVSQDLGCSASSTGQQVSQNTAQPVNNPDTNTNTNPNSNSLSPECKQALLGSGYQKPVHIIKNCIYHFNLACDNCQTGEENNFVFFYTGETTNVLVPAGSVWQYDHQPSKGEVCDPKDHWPETVPKFLSLPGVQLIFPCN